MRYLAGKRLTPQRKAGKDKSREPFGGVLAHDGVNTMNRSMLKPTTARQIHS